jgi:AbrB family transcriptional regulator, transcriptional pleiotropic regulator of transition state genes
LWFSLKNFDFSLILKIQLCSKFSLSVDAIPSTLIYKSSRERLCINMNHSTGIVRKADQLGRIVFPKEMRTSLGISTNDSLEIFIDGNTAIFKKYSPGCNFCGSLAIQTTYLNKPICKECVRNIAKI